MPHTNEEMMRQEFDNFCSKKGLELAENNIADFWLNKISNLKKSIREEIENRKYVFERPKEDYLPEVYKHLKSKNEALDEILSLKSLE